MTLESLNYIAQTIASFAVVGSLIYLAIQTRQANEQTRLNTQALNASAGFQATHSWGEFNEVSMSASAEQIASVLRAYNSETTWEDFADVERFWIIIAHRALFQKLEGQYFLYEYGSLHAAIWEKRRDWAAGLIKLPFFQRWWAFDKSQNIWTDEFIAAIEDARDASAVVPWLIDPAGGPPPGQAAAKP